MANAMGFAVNILWIAIGAAMLAIARSFARSGNRLTAAAVGIIAAAALAMGIFF